ncbi:tyrosine--tRNA ligase [Candidatus Pantoea carbekii]|uniref:Tyrosine--tRNA ligase n=1 Tax=Candidatus Pantoea carbekii TaxID=1235990 RepID=U3U8D7_9GAMM|nr:tyrosine--tRNA ligase [Candidatus Pantoea carbekii]AKC32088.1 tyrosyl-tRNA synthetase TyrS [Candidatus Pantoea carbekii]BAO00614.1 TyrS protein [Candidatus Pantoea carbekii]
MTTDSNVIAQLQERGLIAKITDEVALVKRLQKGPIALYCGFDPTADSLHLGHLVLLLCLKRFQNSGHTPIVLIGGATGLIGDPSFKKTERTLNKIKTVNKWIKKIQNQITLFLNFECGYNSAISVNNYDWFTKMNVLTFLRDLGKHFSVNQMIKREAIKQRLNRDDQGISFTEFSYCLLQSYDFVKLNEHYNVVLQIGGSDQWGNIISGVDLTRRLQKQQVWGLTVPLITKSDGTKFGKTEKGTIWLDGKKTSPYAFYQFWINTSDADVYRFLKFFTFINIQEIKKLEKNNNNDTFLKAQYILAENVTRLVHGENGLLAAKRITKCLFSDNVNEMTENDFEQLLQDGVPSIVLYQTNDLLSALVTARLVTSRTQARTMVTSRAIYINGERELNPEYHFSKKDKLFNRFTLLRRGKKYYCLISWN